MCVYVCMSVFKYLLALVEIRTPKVSIGSPAFWPLDHRAPFSYLTWYKPVLFWMCSKECWQWDHSSNNSSPAVLRLHFFRWEKKERWMTLTVLSIEKIFIASSTMMSPKSSTRRITWRPTKASESINTGIAWHLVSDFYRRNVWLITQCPKCKNDLLGENAKSHRV